MPTLDWLNREAAFQTAAGVPTRVLRPHAAGGRFGDGSDNLLVQADNLEALKALLPFYRGRVKCIFIDPPYNTKSAFEHYDDNLEHSQWLSMMLPRLQLLRDFLREDGSIWVTIDDNEGHYLKVLMDEVFGRGNFVVNALWQKRTSPDARLHIGDAHDHVLVYSRSRSAFALNRLPLSDDHRSSFKNPDNDKRGPWSSTDFTAQGWRPNQMYAISTPSGVSYEPPPGRCWANIEPEFRRLLAEERLWFGKSGDARPRVKNFLSEHEGTSAWSWWQNSEVGHNQEAKKEVLNLFDEAGTFDTPKPERLLARVIALATNPSDLILDSFLGSGTTAAVNWQGGGGFHFVQLGAPLFDEHGDLHPEVRFADLAAFLWLRETGSAYDAAASPVQGTPLLGVHEGRAVYLLYNGILGDRRPQAGNVLTSAVLAAMHFGCWHEGPKVVYGEACLLGDARLAAAGITFRQLPHAVAR